MNLLKSINKNSIVFKKTDFIKISSIIIYRILLDIAYITFVNPIYSYAGFKLEFSYTVFIESYIYMFVFLFIFSFWKKNKSISEVFLNLEFGIMIIPMLSYYGFSEQSRVFLLLVCSSFIVQIFILKLSLKERRINITQVIQIFKVVILGIVTITIVLTFFKYGIPSLAAFDLYGVYDIRAENQLAFPLSYFVPWACRVIIPFFIIFHFDKKQYKFALFFIMLQLFLFLTYPQKTYLFIVVLLIIIYWLQKNNFYERFYYSFLSLMVGVSLVMFHFFQSIFLATTFIRRFLFIPARLKFYYYDFFSINPKVFFADGMIGNLFSIDSPYQYGITTIIASDIHGKYATGANAGYWADAYANLGIGGILLISILLALMILFLQNNTRNLPLEIVVSVSIFPMISFNDSAFFTALLTGGWLILILLLYFYDADIWSKKNAENMRMKLKREIK